VCYACPHPCGKCGRTINNNSRLCWGCAGYSKTRKPSKYGKTYVRERYCVACDAKLRNGKLCVVCKITLRHARCFKKGRTDDTCPPAAQGLREARLWTYEQRARQGLPLFQNVPPPQGGAPC
jgi:hypothetical protein